MHVDVIDRPMSTYPELQCNEMFEPSNIGASRPEILNCPELSFKVGWSHLATCIIILYIYIYAKYAK